MINKGVRKDPARVIKGESFASWLRRQQGREDDAGILAQEVNDEDTPDEYLVLARSFDYDCREKRHSEEVIGYFEGRGDLFGSLVYGVIEEYWKAYDDWEWRKDKQEERKYEKAEKLKRLEIARKREAKLERIRQLNRAKCEAA